MGFTDEGLLALRAGDLSGAVRHLETAVRQDPQDIRAWAALGVALSQAGRGGEGVAAFERAVALGADHAAVHYNLGRALEAVGKAADALQAYRRATRVEPGHAPSLAAIQRLSGATSAGTIVPNPAVPAAGSVYAAGLSDFVLDPQAPAAGGRPDPPQWRQPDAPVPGWPASRQELPAAASPPPAAAPAAPTPRAPSHPAAGPPAAPPPRSGVPWTGWMILGVALIAVTVGGLVLRAGAGPLGQALQAAVPGAANRSLASYRPGATVRDEATGVAACFPAGFPAPVRRTRPSSITESTIYESRSPAGECVFTAINLPASLLARGSADVLGRFQTGSLRGASARAVESRTATYQGYPCLETQFESERDGRNKFGRMRVVLAPPRLIVVALAGRSREATASPAASGFLDSVEIERRAAPSAPAAAAGGRAGSRRQTPASPPQQARPRARVPDLHVPPPPMPPGQLGPGSPIPQPGLGAGSPGAGGGFGTRPGSGPALPGGSGPRPVPPHVTPGFGPSGRPLPGGPPHGFGGPPAPGFGPATGPRGPDSRREPTAGPGSPQPP